MNNHVYNHIVISGGLIAGQTNAKTVRKNEDVEVQLNR